MEKNKVALPIKTLFSFPLDNIRCNCGAILKLVFLLNVIPSVYYVTKRIKFVFHKYKNRTLAHQRRLQRDQEISAIPSFSEEILNDSNLDFLKDASTIELVQALQKGTIKCVEAVSYYLSAVKTQAEYNSVTQVLFEEALDKARALDIAFKESGPVGPLHGLPITVKECIPVLGTSSTGGFAGLLTQRAQDDAHLIKVLKNAGAIIICKSNVPQSLMSCDCSNPIYGSTLNPFDPSRTCGGSSGGEGVLVATGASLVGIGSDLGGSIRYPAAWCGVVGFKPTGDRFSSHGISLNISGQKEVPVTLGPITRNVDDACLILKIWSKYQCDYIVPPLVWNDDQYTKSRPLVIGYWANDDYFCPCSAAQRAVQLVVDQLSAQGHTLVRFQPHNIEKVVSSFFGLITSDLTNLKNMLNFEDTDECLKSNLKVVSLGKVTSSIAYNLLRLLGWYRISDVIPLFSGSLAKVHELVAWKNKYTSELIDKFNNASLDALITFGPSTSAPIRNTAQHIAPSLVSVYLWNFVNFPAGIVPVTSVNKNDVGLPREVSDPIDYFIRKNDINSEGLPVAVQVVGLPWEDEKVLHVMKLIEENNSQFNPTQKLRQKTFEKIKNTTLNERKI